mgnify:CR=1 FL=1
MTTFSINPQLSSDTFQVTDLIMCRVLLMNDRRYPWLILVPMQNGLREFHDLEPEYHSCLMSEITRTTKTLQKIYEPDKLNVGTLGNIVDQLHIHVLGRFRTDPAWPGPVWGVGNPEKYSYAEADQIVRQIRSVLDSFQL